MTLLVGIRCRDGVVVAADQAVTFTTSGKNFTISHLACKLSVLKGGLIIAGTGQVGAKQRFCQTAERAWKELIAGKGLAPVEMCRILAAEAVRDFSSTGMPNGQFGALVAFPATKGGPQLCEFTIDNFQPELKDAGSWFVSMGSGQLIADSYLAFMREVFWHDGMPNLKHALFAAAWVMRQSIRVAPGFISEPVDMAILQGDKAEMVDPDKLRYHMDVADRATEYFRRFDPTELTPSSEMPPAAPPDPIPSPQVG